jgi:hypothetical protein
MADAKQKEVATLTPTFTLASLASDASQLAGRQSDIINNEANEYLDYLVSGKITTGTTPTASKSIEVWAFAAVNDTPTYPDQFGASDANRSPTSRDILGGSARLLWAIPTDGTTSRTYWFGPISLAALFGGALPRRFGFYVVHNTGVNLNATAGNHALYADPKYATVG